MIKISVIVPIYNVQKYIHKCVYSIINQKLNDIEIILVNDGSTDNSGKICDQYASKDSRIKVIHKENGGVSSARNEGIRVATGEYIGFVDGDDYIELNMYSELYAHSNNGKIDVVCCRLKQTTSSKNWNYTYFENKIMYKKDIGNQVIPLILKGEIETFITTKIYKRNKVKDIYLEKQSFLEDYIYNIEVLKRIDTLYYVPIVFYHYRILAESGIRRYKQNNYYIYQLVKKRKNELIQIYQMDIEIYMECINLCFLDEVASCILQEGVRKKEDRYQKYKEICEDIEFNNVITKYMRIYNYGMLKNIMLKKMINKEYMYLDFIVRTVYNKNKLQQHVKEGIIGIGRNEK